MIDWNKPLKAISSSGKIVTVHIDHSYHRKETAVPVKFPCNLWADTSVPGTWYFDKDGMAVAGVSPDGYEAKYRLSN